VQKRLERTHCPPYMDILNRQFGLIIAYLLPGFVALFGIAPLVPNVATWLHADQTAGFGAPVYALLAATAAGMVVSCFRWFLLDPALALTGVTPVPFNARALEERQGAFSLLVENHYKFYQFYANTLIAVMWAYSIHRWLRTSPLFGLGSDIGVFILCAVLFAGSRDALSKYRARTGQLFKPFTLQEMDGAVMTNGIDHNQGSGTGSNKPSTPPRPPTKPEVPAKPQPAERGEKPLKG
jgi:hypothetical protein